MISLVYWPWEIGQIWNDPECQDSRCLEAGQREAVPSTEGRAVNTAELRRGQMMRLLKERTQIDEQGTKD